MNTWALGAAWGLWGVIVRNFILLIIIAVSLTFGSIAVAQRGMSANSLKVDNLNYESEILAIFLGDFANARMEPESSQYSVLLSGFIGAFSRKCDSSLPANKVEIMASRCVAEQVTRNGFGVEISRSCARYETYGTGRFADPVLLAISKRTQGQQSNILLGDILNGQGRAPGAGARQMTDVALAAQGDMDTLINQNQCGSAAMARLQTNLKRFGNGERGLKLANGATLASVRQGSGASGAYVPSDYGAMIDALVAENARGWMINRYVRGSVSSVSVGSKDAAGRPGRVTASYGFNTLGQISRGNVVLTFEDGRPACLYYSDAPRTCRIPSPGIVTAYEKGEYRRR